MIDPYTEALAAIARRWKADAVGRDYPHHVKRSDGYRYIVAGNWYLIRQGKRIPANAAQARVLNAIRSTLPAYSSIKVTV